MPKKLLPLLMLCLLLTGCAAGESTPTGVSAGRIEQPQVMYHSQVYFYCATGFDEPLPGSFCYVGSIEAVDHTVTPAADFSGCQVEEGQRVFADLDHPDMIYLQYENGYARFSLPD